MLGWEFPPLSIGGLGTHTYGLAESLSKKSVKIDFYMPKTKKKITEKWLNIIQIPFSKDWLTKPINKINPYLELRKELNSINLDVNSITNSKWDLYSRLCAKALLKKHKKEPYKLIHCQAWFGLKAALLFKKWSKLPIIITLHTSEYGKYGKKINKKIIEIEKTCVKQADKIIVVSNLLRKIFLKKYKINPKKIKTIPNGISEDFFKKKLKPKRYAKKQVLFVGRLKPYKNIEIILKVAKKVLEEEKDVKFVVVGNGENIKKYENISKKLKIRENVIFTGHLPYHKLLNIYAGSDVYLLLSKFDAFGLTALEAMASGIPVIVSRTTGISELVKNCIKVDYWNIREITKEIVNLLKNEKLRISLGKKAQAEAKKFLWNRIAKEYVKLYREISS